MRAQWSTASGRTVRGVLTLLGGFALALMLYTVAFGAYPPAGSVIGNQASATYTDTGGQTKTATSNLVETVVQQVGAFSLVQDNAKTASPGNTVYMPHTLTNLGNGSDSFTLAVANNSGTFDFSAVAIYADANGDGVPDGTTALCASPCTSFTTPSLPSGGVFKLVVALTVPTSAVADQTDNVSVTATPVGYPATPSSITNTDTVNITGNGAFQVTKSITSTQGPAGRTTVYRLTYTNVGASSATLALSDVIGTGATAGFDYVEDTAQWSAGPTVLTDANGGADATVGGMTITYTAINAGGASTPGDWGAISGGTTTIGATITNIAPNVTGFISFTVYVKSTAAPGVSTTTNTAMYGVDTATVATNPATYNVQSAYSLVFNDGTAGPTDANNNRPLAGDTDSPANADLLYLASATPGQTYSFDNYVWNTGNQSDTFNVTASLMAGGGGYGTWPAGTTIQLFKSDGSSPLMDTNGDGIPDTGPMATTTSYKVVLKVTIPANACSAGCPTGPFDVEKVATSVGNSSINNKTYDRIGALSGDTAPRVDVANSSGGTYSSDPGSVWSTTNQDPVSSVPTTTKTTLPGQPTVFTLYVRNEGMSPDTYDLRWSGSNFASGSGLPAGWTVEFRGYLSSGSSCSPTAGTAITKIGPIPSQTEWKTCAVVTPPAGAAAGTTNVYFQVYSQSSGAIDTKMDAVTVQSVNQLVLAPSNTGQVAPGGTVVYAHTLTNTGNTSCTQPYTFSITGMGAGWTYTLYLDVNGDGVLDAGDTQVPGTLPALASPATLTAGSQVKLLVKVFAPAGATAGVADTVTLTVSSTCGGSATTTQPVPDTTTVIAGQVRLVKTQAVAACGSTPSSLTYAATKLTANPGGCIFYRVVATNEGTSAVTLQTISDTLPAYTTSNGALATNPLCTRPDSATFTGSFSSPTFSCNFGGASLPAAGTAMMYMSVQINQ